MQNGDVYKSNHWGDVEILNYKSNRIVEFRFLNSGNIYSTQKVNILTGLIKDIDLQMKETLERDNNYKLFMAKRRCFQSFVRDLKSWKTDEVRYHKSIKKDYRDNFRKFYKNKWDRKDISLKLKAREEATLKRREYSKTAYDSNRDYRLQKAKDWQKKNPEKANNRNRNRRAKRKAAEGTHTLNETNMLLESQNNKCACCKFDLEEGKHLDHIMPLTLGGSNWIDNLQWLCPFCNLSKNAKHPDDWAAEVANPNFMKRRFSS